MSEFSGDRLIALARATDSASRNALLLALSDLCAERPFGLGEDASIAEDIFLRLAKAAELAVRVQLSLRLASTPWAPRSLILLLAVDEIQVAEPVLTASPVLREDDLIDIANRLSRAHRRALARRPGLPGAVCEAVTRAGESDVIRVLIENATAELTAPALRHCLATAEAEAALCEAPPDRGDLSEPLVDIAYWAAGSALMDQISRRYPQMAELAAAETEGAVNMALAARNSGPGLSADERLVQEASGAGGLDGFFLLEAVQDGRLSLFELGLACLAGCELNIVKIALDRHRATGLALALRAGGLEGRDCSRIGVALARMGRLKGEFDHEARTECAAVFRDLTPDAARAALRRSGAAA